jgi:hypothetical protein
MRLAGCRSCAATGLELLQFLHALFERRVEFHRSKTLGAQPAIERRRFQISRSSLPLAFPPAGRLVTPEGRVFRDLTTQTLLIQDVPSAQRSEGPCAGSVERLVRRRSIASSLRGTSRNAAADGRVILEEDVECDMARPPRSDDDAIVGRGIQEQVAVLNWFEELKRLVPTR